MNYFFNIFRQLQRLAKRLGWMLAADSRVEKFCQRFRWASPTSIPIFLLATVNRLSQQSVRRFGAQYDSFSLFIFVFYLANPFKWQILGIHPSAFITFLRALAVVLWLMLVFWRNWPRKLKGYLPLFWHFSLFYHLTFRTAFNILYSEHSPVYDSSKLVGIVALAILVDNREFCILTLLGTIFASAICLIFGDTFLPVAEAHTILYALMMVFAISFIKFMFFRTHDQRINERCNAYKILAGAIAHEVRSPISTVNIACENLPLISDSRKNEFLPIIKKQTRKALSVIDSILLQVGYIENKKKPKCLSISLEECIDEVLSDTNFSELEIARIRVELAHDFLVVADRLLLVQVLTNLVKNALFATNNLEDVKIIISATKADNLLKISVFDNGIGISSHRMKELFYPFLSHNENGAGIGLAFCKLAVNNMNGSIKCESEPGKYTRFTIELLSGDKPKIIKPEALKPALTKKAIKLA